MPPPAPAERRRPRPPAMPVSLPLARRLLVDVPGDGAVPCLDQREPPGGGGVKGEPSGPALVGSTPPARAVAFAAKAGLGRDAARSGGSWVAVSHSPPIRG